ncbi:MAG: hypothetical protein K2H98_04060 [Duncaniella sp.]|nr:hypothetical protein [Duncaniella sp.]
MISEIKQPNDAALFREWLQSLPYRDYHRVRREMFARCLVAKHTFHNWLSGVCRIPALAKQTINNVAREYNNTTIFDLSELAGSGVDGESNAAGDAR